MTEHNKQKQGLLITTSYTPPRMSLITWEEERRAVVIITSQDGVDYTDPKKYSEAQRRRPKHAIIPIRETSTKNQLATIGAWEERIEKAQELHKQYVDYVERLKMLVAMSNLKSDELSEGMTYVIDATQPINRDDFNSIDWEAKVKEDRDDE